MSDEGSGDFVDLRGRPLFPRRAQIVIPKRENTADSEGEVIADDNIRYFVKDDKYNRRIRAAEWLCTAISELVGIAAPYYVTVEMPDGRILFGSRAIAGVAVAAETHAYLNTQTYGNQGIEATLLRKVISSIFALDLFLFNDDRHLGNYLTILDGNSRRLYAFDFSRALFWHWPMILGHANDPITKIDCHTRHFGRQLQRLHGFDAQEALDTLNRIERLEWAHLERHIEDMPTGWLPPEMAQSFREWWEGEPKRARLAAIRSGITNGTLL